MQRILLMAVGILVVGDALSNSTQAQNGQQNVQWCAYFTGGPTTCGFAAFDDCLQAIKGKAALCVQSAQYVRAARPRTKRAPPRRLPPLASRSSPTGASRSSSTGDGAVGGPDDGLGFRQ
jgi:hypothetical protein